MMEKNNFTAGDAFPEILAQLEVQHINCSIEGRPVLNDVSLCFSPGEIVGIFGENGAGKTTLVKSILGMIPCEGKVLINEQRLNRWNAGNLSFAISEHSFFPGLSAKAHKHFFGYAFKNFREARFEQLMKIFAIPRHKPLGKLSSAQQDCFEAAIALCQGAKYIFLDDCFSPENRFFQQEFYGLLPEMLSDDETLIVSAASAEELEGFATRVVMLRSGWVIGDRQLSDLQKEQMTLTKYLKLNYNYRAEKARIELSGKNRGAAL